MEKQIKFNWNLTSKKNTLSFSIFVFTCVSCSGFELICIVSVWMICCIEPSSEWTFDCFSIECDSWGWFDRFLWVCARAKRERQWIGIIFFYGKRIIGSSQFVFVFRLIILICVCVNVLSAVPIQSYNSVISVSWFCQIFFRDPIDSSDLASSCDRCSDGSCKWVGVHLCMT